MMSNRDFVVDLTAIDAEDSLTVGRNASQMGELHHLKIPVKKGFVITPQAFFIFVKANKLDYKINHLLGAANFDDPNSVYQIAGHIRKIIRQAPVPEEIAGDIFAHYKKMNGLLSHASVSISYSLIGNLSKYKIATDQNAYIVGESHILEATRNLWAALFTAEVVHHEREQVFNHLKNAMAVMVQKASNPQVSGMLYTKDPVTHAKNLVINAIHGILDESNPSYDTYVINKFDHSVFEQTLRMQEMQRIVKNGEVIIVPVAHFLKKHAKLTTSDLHRLISYAQIIEKHYYFPQAVKWFKEDGKIYIESVKQQSLDIREKLEPPKEAMLAHDLLYSHYIISGSGFGKTIGIGPIVVIKSEADYKKIKKGSVVVTKSVAQKHIHEFKKASALILEDTNKSHDLLYFLHMHPIPVITGVTDATRLLKDHHVVTVHPKTGRVTKGSMMVHHKF